MNNPAQPAGTTGGTSDSAPKKNKPSAWAAFMSATAIGLLLTFSGGSYAEPLQEATPFEKITNLFKSAVNDNRVMVDNYQHDEEWTIRVTDSISQTMAIDVINKIYELNKKDPHKTIEIRVNSTGGSVDEGLAIYDVMRTISNPIRTVCEGRAASMGAIILAGGDPGQRLTYEHCSIMIHEIAWGTDGKISAMKDITNEGNRQNEQLIAILSKHSGLSKDDLRVIMTRDLYLNGAKEAQSMGLVDKIIAPKPLPPAAPRQLPENFCDQMNRQNLRVCPPPPPDVR